MKRFTAEPQDRRLSSVTRKCHLRRLVCSLDPRESVSADPARPHLQGDEFVGSRADAVHSVGSGVRLARPAKHRGPSLRWQQDQEAVRQPSVARLWTRLLWPPYVIGGPLCFCPVISICLLLSSFFSSPNLSGRRLDVYRTLTHGVALVRI